MKQSEGIIAPFRFKHFSVNHTHSSMKVGVDAVLLGAWADVRGSRGLDLGCGCGVIALMCAQRNPAAEILAVDLHDASAEEAAFNFSSSPWSARLEARAMDANALRGIREMDGSFDFIVSNPPYFLSGVREPESPREKARHQASLSPQVAVSLAEVLLKEGGTLSLVMPYEGWQEQTRSECLVPLRICTVANRPGKTPKRILVSLVKGNGSIQECEQLFIRTADGEYSKEYKTLTSAFYLAF